MGEQFFQGRDLLLGKVTSVVDHYVEQWNIATKTLPEVSIGLVANKHMDVLIFVGFAGCRNIDAIDMRLRPEVVPPHLQTATAIDTDFQNVYVLPSETPEMTVVDFKVMIPLPDPASSFVILEIFPKSVFLGFLSESGTRTPVRELPMFVAAPDGIDVLRKYFKSGKHAT